MNSLPPHEALPSTRALPGLQPSQLPTLAVDSASGSESVDSLRDKATTLPKDAPTSVGPLPTIPGYETLAELGRGGMGVVYKARQVGLDRIVALKMIRAATQAGPDELARFEIEAQAVARLQHPNIVQIYEIGAHDGHPYFSLEFVDAGNLAVKLNGTPQQANQAADMVRTLAQAVHAAHQKNILHRDLKPANVLLTIDGTPKVADFGLAKQMDADVGRTQSGAIFGTPSYMAPEQASGMARALGPATDVYALGAILYEMLTGRPPFRGATLLDTLELVRSAEPVPPSRLHPKVPRDLETICQKCLEKDPARRYATAAELAEDLRRYLTGEPIVARAIGTFGRLQRWCRRKPAAAMLVLVLLTSLGIILGLGFWSYRTVREQLHESLYQQARALWLAREPGWREQSLTALRQASQIRADARLRDQAAQTLVTWDTRLVQELALGESAIATASVVRYDGGELAVAVVGTIQLWDFRAGVLRGTLPTKSRGLTSCLQYGVDGRRLCSAGEDGVHVWDLAEQKHLRLLQAENAGPMQAACFGPGTSALSATDGREVFVWSQETGQLLCREPIDLPVAPAPAPKEPAPAPKKVSGNDQCPHAQSLISLDLAAQNPAPPVPSRPLPPFPAATLVAGVKSPFVLAATATAPTVHWRFDGRKLVERQEVPLPTGANLRMVLSGDESHVFLACNQPDWHAPPKAEPAPAPKKAAASPDLAPMALPNRFGIGECVMVATPCVLMQVPPPNQTPDTMPRPSSPTPPPSPMLPPSPMQSQTTAAPAPDTGGGAGGAGASSANLFGGSGGTAMPAVPMSTPSAAVGVGEATGRATTDVGDLFGHRVSTDIGDLLGSKLHAYLWLFRFCVRAA